MGRSAALYDTLSDEFPHQASYAVSMAYRMRYVMQFNAREAIHMLELRSSPQGHPAYRRVVLEMHRLIAEQAGHRADRRGDDAPDHWRRPSSSGWRPSGAPKADAATADVRHL